MERRPRPMWRALPFLLVTVALLVAACGGGSEPQGSRAEKPAAGEAEPEPDPSLPLIEVATQGRIGFDTAKLEAPAGEPFQIMFRNDSNQIHNLAVYEMMGDVPLLRTPLFQGELFQGPATKLYEVPALEPGTYVFYCDAHSSEGMKGEFVVG